MSNSKGSRWLAQARHRCTACCASLQAPGCDRLLAIDLRLASLQALMQPCSMWRGTGVLWATVYNLQALQQRCFRG